MKEEASKKTRRAYLDRLAVRARTDREAFVELYNEVFPDVSRFLLSKSRSGEIADEALSRTFFNMYIHLVVSLDNFLRLGVHLNCTATTCIVNDEVLRDGTLGEGQYADGLNGRTDVAEYVEETTL